jgi:hypothetical protein
MAFSTSNAEYTHIIFLKAKSFPTRLNTLDSYQIIKDRSLMEFARGQKYNRENKRLSVF